MDFDTLTNYFYPGVLKLMGGKEKAIELLNSRFDSLKENGFVFEKSDVLECQMLFLRRINIAVILKDSIKRLRMARRTKSKSYVLGIYNDETKSWYFIEAKQLKNKLMMNLVLPNFKTSLEIPDDAMTTEDL